MTRGLQPEDVFAFVHAAEVAIAPRGGGLAAIFVRRDRATDRRIASLALWDGDWRELPDSIGASTARWSPDGRSLAFLRRHDNVSALVLLDLVTGALRTLAAGPAPMRELAWSPDSAAIAFQRQEPVDAHPWLSLPSPAPGETWAPPPSVTERLLYRHDTVGILPHATFQTFLVTRDASLRQLTSGDWFSGFYAPPGLAFTPDGAGLVLAASRRADWDQHAGEIPIQHIDLATAAVRQLTDEPGAQAAPAVSPDGRTLAYTAVHERKLSGQIRHVVLRDLATGATRLLAPTLDRPVDSLAWAADGSGLYLASDGPGYRGIVFAPLGGQPNEIVRNLGSGGIENPYQGGGFSLAADGTLAYVQAAIDSPGEVVLRGPNGAVRVLTALNDALAQAVGGFAGAEVLSVPASSDGAPIQAWLMKPTGLPPEGGWPVILEIHGGPYAAYGERFAMKFQMLVAAGYAVVFANPRGSVGYGEAFATGLHDKFPGPDHDDLMDVMDAVIARPDIDAARQFITGISGGGTLTLWAIGHTTRFRAAVSIKPVVAWESWMLTADIGPQIGRVWLGQDLPWLAQDKFRALSPLVHLTAARTPTLLMAGEADSRTPISEAEQAYACLKMLGVEAGFLRFPGASHSSAAMRPSHVAAEVTATLAWFNRF